MNDPSPPEKRPGDGDRAGRQEMETLNVGRRQPRRDWIQAEILRLDREIDRLIAQSNASQEIVHEAIMAAVRIWSGKRWLEDRLQPARFRRWSN
jgi:hypothetical protein